MKGVLQMAKAGTKSTLKAGKQALVATGKGFVKQAGKAKFAVQSVGKGIAKGVKSLDELGQRLAKKFKFKGFKIVVKGFKFYLYGNVNPWVLLASGEVKKVQTTKGTKVGDSGKYLLKGSDEMVEGIIVGMKERGISNFVKQLRNNKEFANAVNKLLNNAKHIDSKHLIRGLSNVPADKLDVIFKAIQNMSNVNGIAKVVQDLAIKGKKSLGAQWVLEYFGKNPALAKMVQSLEEAATNVGKGTLPPILRTTFSSS